MKISILDQSPISEGQTAIEALKETIELAGLAEKLGYERFWVSEHHDTATLAGSSPEVLLAHLAAKTTTIRLGSGGVMLPHYSAYKVAENFKLLSALAPQRIDLGLGKAPGGMPRASFALSDGRKREVDRYPEQIDDVLAYLHDQPVPHVYTGVKATPIVDMPPDVWLLGSSPSSAVLAAEKGLPYTFAKFINGDGGKKEIHEYRSQFQPSAYLNAPKTNIAVFLICAETDEEAQYLASSLELSLMMSGQGIPSNGTPSPEKAAAYSYGKFEMMHVEENRKRMIVGGLETVRKKLDQLVEECGTDEVMAVTIMYDFEKKKRSFELLAQAADL
ncbi:LLM class flavin-dependent oxidoreductase [Domibacillus tundrae]|uniref:LLM class flavin-dependent oxidoreductase n=1 Tax=Domibacillus tundrae TaxID=1587527 RepID=UPI000617C8D0|nr:LLM class flavin-dependent oxidoreductase [Domibacillus tundrae]